MQKAIVISLSILFLVLNLSAFYHALVPFEIILTANALFLLILAIRFSQHHIDPFNPISVIIAVNLLRVYVPALALLSGAEPLPLFQRGAFWSSGIYWKDGFALWAIGLLSLIIGWLMTPRPFTSLFRKGNLQPLNIVLKDERVKITAIVYMAVGGILWIYYMGLNFGDMDGIVHAILSGVLRGPDHKVPGTTRYIYLSQGFLLWGSLIWGANTYKRTNHVRHALYPSLFVFVTRAPFGGRAFAFRPLIMMLLCIWYLKRKDDMNSLRSTQGALLLKLAIRGSIVLFIILYLGSIFVAYRGGGGTEGAFSALSPTAFVDYLNLNVWYELGFLHPFAYAVFFGAGSYKASLLRYLVGGYSAYFMGLEDYVKPGGFITQVLTGAGGWGIHTGAVVDLFMGFNLWIMIIGLMGLGAVFKMNYASMIHDDSSTLRVVLYCYIFFVVFWSLFETVVGVFTATMENLLIFLLPFLAMSSVLPKSKRTETYAK